MGLIINFHFYILLSVPTHISLLGVGRVFYPGMLYLNLVHRYFESSAVSLPHVL